MGGNIPAGDGKGPAFNLHGCRKFWKKRFDGIFGDWEVLVCGEEAGGTWGKLRRSWPALELIPATDEEESPGSSLGTVLDPRFPTSSPPQLTVAGLALT